MCNGDRNLHKMYKNSLINLPLSMDCANAITMINQTRKMSTKSLGECSLILQNNRNM